MAAVKHWLVTYQQNLSNGEPMKVNEVSTKAPADWLIEALGRETNQGTDLVMLNWLPITAAQYQKLRELV